MAWQITPFSSGGYGRVILADLEVEDEVRFSRSRKLRCAAVVRHMTESSSAPAPTARGKEETLREVFHLD